MALINPLPYLKLAQERGIAIAAFNVHNMETIQAVAEGAVEENSPVIIQTTPGTLKHAGLPFVAANVKTAAEEYQIPIALHLDHCSSFELIVQAIRQGYTSIMIDGSTLPYEDNVILVKKVVELAGAVGVPVEGEIGRIAGVEDDLQLEKEDSFLTIPAQAKEFAELTGVDTLAIAIGTAHGIYKGEPVLDFLRLEEIKELVEIPLVLHGASGVADRDIKRAIDRGICKVNIATELKIPLADAIKSCFLDDASENDPRRYLGKGKEAVKKIVKKKIKLCGTSNLLNKLRWESTTFSPCPL